jgi:hypothetical protein
MWDPKTPPPTIIPVARVCCFVSDMRTATLFAWRKRCEARVHWPWPGSQSRFLCWKNGHTSMRERRLIRQKIPRSYLLGFTARQDLQRTRSVRAIPQGYISCRRRSRCRKHRNGLPSEDRDRWGHVLHGDWGVSGCSALISAPGMANGCSKAPSMPHKLCSALPLLLLGSGSEFVIMLSSWVEAEASFYVTAVYFIRPRRTITFF